MNNMLWAVEYSNSQNCFNIALLTDILDINLTNYLSKNGSDYQILFIGSRDECVQFVNEMQKR